MVAAMKPDIIILDSPHGVKLTNAFSVSTNGKAKGDCEWNDQWKQFEVRHRTLYLYKVTTIFVNVKLFITSNIQRGLINIICRLLLLLIIYDIVCSEKVLGIHVGNNYHVKSNLKKKVI